MRQYNYTIFVRITSVIFFGKNRLKSRNFGIGYDGLCSHFPILCHRNPIAEYLKYLSYELLSYFISFLQINSKKKIF